MTSSVALSRETAVGAEARLSWILSALAGMVGAVAFLHSAGYFVTFMTGNTERAVIGHFGSPEGKPVAPGASPWAALALMGAFLAGVVIASICRRRYWSNHPHGATVVTTIALAAAGLTDIGLGVRRRKFLSHSVGCVRPRRAQHSIHETRRNLHPPELRHRHRRQTGPRDRKTPTGRRYLPRLALLCNASRVFRSRRRSRGSDRCRDHRTSSTPGYRSHQPACKHLHLHSHRATIPMGIGLFPASENLRVRAPEIVLLHRRTRPTETLSQREPIGLGAWRGCSIHHLSLGPDLFAKASAMPVVERSPGQRGQARTRTADGTCRRDPRARHDHRGPNRRPDPAGGALIACRGASRPTGGTPSRKGPPPLRHARSENRGQSAGWRRMKSTIPGTMEAIRPCSGARIPF